MTSYSRAGRRVAAAHPNPHISCLAVCSPSTRSCCRDSNRLLPSIAPAQSFVNDDGAACLAPAARNLTGAATLPLPVTATALALT